MKAIVAVWCALFVVIFEARAASILANGETKDEILANFEQRIREELSGHVDKIKSDLEWYKLPKIKEAKWQQLNATLEQHLVQFSNDAKDPNERPPISDLVNRIQSTLNDFVRDAGKELAENYGCSVQNLQGGSASQDEGNHGGNYGGGHGYQGGNQGGSQGGNQGGSQGGNQGGNQGLGAVTGVLQHGLQNIQLEVIDLVSSLGLGLGVGEGQNNNIVG